jgi:hypothetical protein
MKLHYLLQYTFCFRIDARMQSHARRDSFVTNNRPKQALTEPHRRPPAKVGGLVIYGVIHGISSSFPVVFLASRPRCACCASSSL